MLAPATQMSRWQAMLSVASPEAGDAAAVGTPTETIGSHRAFMKACVAGVHRLRAGAQLALPGPLPDVPASRPAAEGSAVADAVWLAYVHFVAGEPAAAPWLTRMTAALSPVALRFSIDDNPEPWWQNEMLILHALHSFALLRGESALLDQTLAAADFHLREIQPDHATNEPWAVHAYASHADGAMTAETLWHAAYIQHGGWPGPVARLIASDAAFTLAAHLRS